MPLDHPRTREMEQALIVLVERSLLARVPRRLVTALETGYQHSRLRRLIETTSAGWRASGRSVQRRTAGIAVITAVLVHIALTMAHAKPAGWYWIVIPAIAAAQGALLLLMSIGKEPQS